MDLDQALGMSNIISAVVSLTYRELVILRFPFFSKGYEIARFNSTPLDNCVHNVFSEPEEKRKTDFGECLTYTFNCENGL